MIQKALLFFITVFTFISCNSDYHEIRSENNQEIVGTINNTSISLSDIDKTVQQELYDELYRIYLIRKTAFKEYVNNYMLTTEAGKYQLSKEQYLDNYFQVHFNQKSLEAYIKRNNIQFLPELKRGLNNYDIETEKGKELLMKSYKEHLKRLLLDSLKIIYKPHINIQPPFPPEIRLNEIATVYRGNLKSSVTLLEISDIECGKCREYKPVYDKIYKKFKSKIRFGFIHYSSYPTLSAIACNAAEKQGKFWEMLDSLMVGNTLADIHQIIRIAKNLGMDLKQFTKNLNDPDAPSRLEYNYKLLKAYGIYATPTILINGKPVFNSSSMDAIEEQIKIELQ